MAAMNICLAFLLSLAATSVLGSPHWDTLKVKWPLSTGIPRTTKEATSSRYQLATNLCGDAKPFALWRGYIYKYLDNDDVIPIYDKNGYIAGIQTSISTHDKKELYPGNQKIFVEYSRRYYLTAYFVHPSKICTGRTAQEFAEQGTGTDLYIQTGPNPETDFMKVPFNQSDMSTQSNWVLGKCFPTMGVHYWNNLTEDMDCKDFFPVFLLYNGNILTGFGWAMMVKEKGDLYEHPPSSVFGKFMQKVPTCAKKVSVTTQHIYFSSYNFC